jgi:hypothetical protein
MLLTQRQRNVQSHVFVRTDIDSWKATNQNEFNGSRRAELSVWYTYSMADIITFGHLVFKLRMT